MKKVIVTVCAACSIVFGSTDTNVTTSMNGSCEKLQLSIDSLNAKVDRLLFENKADNNPMATGRYKDWGTKFYGGILLSLNDPELEFGYSKRIGQMRYGAGLGLKRFYGYGYSDNGSAGFAKIIASTPIYMNFMSFSGYFKTIYHSREVFWGSKNSRLGVGAGFGMESWIANNLCIYFQSSLTMYKRVGITSDTTAIVGPFGMSESNFGIRCYFGHSKKSSQAE